MVCIDNSPKAHSAQAWSTRLAMAALAASPLFFPRMAQAADPVSLASMPSVASGVQVRANPNVPWQPATPDVRISVGTMVKTAGQPQVVRLVDGTSLTLEPSTVVQFHPTVDVQLDPPAQTRMSRVDLKAGGLVASIAPQTGKPLLVMASTDRYAAFRAGRARARLTPDGLLVASYASQARVAWQGRWTLVGPNQVQVLRSAGAQTGPQPLPPAPSWANQVCAAGAGRACALTLTDGAARPLGVRWARQGPDVTYQAVVARNAELTEEVAKVSLPAGSTEYVTPALAAGSYWIGITALSKEGVEGGTSIRPARVIRISPEPGGIYHPQERALVLPAGRSAMLREVDGVQTLVNATTWGPAPSKITLVAGETRRQLRLRLPDVPTDEAPLAVELRELKAEISLGPATARWPRDKVSLSVRVSDPSGRMPADTVKPALRVQVNQQTIQVPIEKKSATTWTGVVPTQPGNGPWVIRVTASDDEGNVIGRGMLEVVGKDPPKMGSRVQW